MDSEEVQVESEVAQAESEVVQAESEVNPVETSIRKLPQDVWNVIVKHLNGKEVACLAASAPFIRQMVDHPPVWKLAFLREFGLPDPGDNVVIDWKLFYARAYPKSRVTSIGGENIGWVRIGVFNIESTSALLAEIYSSTKKATPGDTAHNLLGAWNPNLLAQHVTPGLWIAFAKVTAGATVPPGETPGEVIIELDVRHVNRFLETGIENLVYETYWAYSPVLTDGGFHAALFDRNSMHEAHNLCTIDDWEVMELPSSWSGPPIMIKSYIGPHCVGMGVTLQLAEGVKQRRAIGYGLKKDNINVDWGFQHNAMLISSNAGFMF